ncbi:MAG: DUF6452 family protein [Christiangramia sp.]
MKLKIYSILLAMSLLVALGCQRDDICPETTDTTPFLIIKFYDIENPDESVAPQNLSINEIGNEEYVTIRNGSDQIIEYKRRTSDSIAIPLRTDTDLTELEFTVNDPRDEEEPDPENLPNTDIIRFTYGRQEEYINRACAFKVNYVGLKLTPDSGDDGAWIQDIRIEEVNIEDQNQAHVSIFF